MRSRLPVEPAGAPSVLILVENNSVPADSRVWQISRSLVAAGWRVTVLSPRGETRDRETLELLDGIEIHRFDLASSNGGASGYLREYVAAHVRMRELVRDLSRDRSYDVVHACSPPDTLLLVARTLRRRGAGTIFDHHDLSPELFAAKYPRFATAGQLLRLPERIGFSLADVVLATNESFREVAVTRGGKSGKDVFVVRNGPDSTVFRPVTPDPAIRGLAPFILGYVGLIGHQDGVDVALRALAVLRERRSDWHAVFVGDGDALPAARESARRLGLDEYVSFTGFVGDRAPLVRLIASFDVCLSPEPRNPLNEHSTLIKVAEYMAVERPVVAFDLTETRRTAGDAAAYSATDDPAAFADAVAELLDNPERRQAMGREGRARVTAALDWEHAERSLFEAYARAREVAATRSSRRDL